MCTLGESPGHPGAEWCSLGSYRFSVGCVGAQLNTGMMAPTFCPCERRAQHRDNGGCSSRPCLGDTQLSHSDCLWCLLSCHSPTRARRECLRASESVQRSLKSAWVFSSLPSPVDGRNPCGFPRPRARGPLFPILELQAGGAGVGLRPLAPQEVPAAVSPNS